MTRRSLLQVSMNLEDLQHQRVRVGKRVIRLPRMEHYLVVYLLSQPPTLWIHPQQIMEELWHVDDVPDTWRDCIKVMAHRLRSKGIPIVGNRHKGLNGYRIPFREEDSV